MIEPQYDGQVARDLLITLDPQSVARMNEFNPPGAWVQARIDYRSPGYTEQGPVPIGSNTPTGPYLFMEAAQIQAMELAAQSNFAFTEVDANGDPLQAADNEVDDLGTQLVTYGVSTEIVPTTDGNWTVHPNSAESFTPSEHQVDGDSYGEQWKHESYAAGRIGLDDLSRSSGELSREQRAYEAEAEHWEGVLEDVSTPEAAPTRDTLVEVEPQSDKLLAQQTALLVFAETTADFDREQLLEQAKASDGWEGLNGASFMAAAGMYRYMREAEGPAEERSPEQEMGRAKDTWNIRIPGLDKVREHVGAAVKYCSDPAFRKEQNTKAAESTKGFFGRIGARVSAEAKGLREGVKERVAAAYKGVTETTKDMATKAVDYATERAAAVRDKVVDGATAVRDVTVDAATAARDGVSHAASATASAVRDGASAAKTGVQLGAASVTEKAADGLEAVLTAPERMRAKAAALREQAAASKVDPEVSGSEQPEVAQAPAAAIPDLAERMSGKVTPSVDEQGRKLEQVDLLLVVDKHEGAELQSNVVVNQESYARDHGDYLADPNLVVGEGVGTDVLRKLHERGINEPHVSELEGGGARYVLSARAELPLDESGRPVLDSLSSVSTMADPGPDVSPDVLVDQANSTQLARDRSRRANVIEHQQEAPAAKAPEAKPVIVSRDEDLLTRDSSPDYGGGYER